MNARWVAIVIVLVAMTGLTMAQAQTPGDDAKRLREEIQRVEAQIKELNAQLDSLKARLAKAEPPSPQPPVLRFPFDIERAMLQDGLSTPVAPQTPLRRFDRLPEVSPLPQPRRPK